jgi:hypothetical protein
VPSTAPIETAAPWETDSLLTCLTLGG